MYQRFRQFLHDWFGIRWWRYYESDVNPFEHEMFMRECRLTGRTQCLIWTGGLCMWDDVEHYE